MMYVSGVGDMNSRRGEREERKDEAVVASIVPETLGCFCCDVLCTL
jgi:hypothetical protein